MNEKKKKAVAHNAGGRKQMNGRRNIQTNGLTYWLWTTMLRCRWPILRLEGNLCLGLRRSRNGNLSPFLFIILPLLSIKIPLVR